METKQIPLGQYISVRKAIETAPLPDGGNSVVSPDDPMYEIMHELANVEVFGYEPFPDNFDYPAPSEPAESPNPRLYLN